VCGFAENAQNNLPETSFPFRCFVRIKSFSATGFHEEMIKLMMEQK